MHDTAFSKEIIRVIMNKLKELDDNSKISCVNVRLSPLSHVRPATLKETFLQLAQSHNLEDVTLKVRLSKIELRCKSCGKIFLSSEPVFVCPCCKQKEFNINEGPEFFVESLEIERKQNICIWFDSCPLKKFYEQGQLSKKWIKDYCWGDNSRCIRKEMEEKGEYHPDNMMPDGTIDAALK